MAVGKVRVGLAVGVRVCILEFWGVIEFNIELVLGAGALVKYQDQLLLSMMDRDSEVRTFEREA